MLGSTAANADRLASQGGTSSRIIPTAISTRPRSFHYELQGSRRKACCEAPRRRNLEGMTIDADKDKQTHDGTSVNANADRTAAGNVSTVTTNAVILDQMKEMFASAQKKSDEQGKLVASLAKQVETLTAKAKSKNPRRATRARSGRRLDFNERSGHTDR
ncbi:hypothetical protein F2Q69_00020041 [Brassica cretica]|uniref:Uncharacterized protein n=1 Tax=Brassica cretica TaxID=69181 RepID=A0A8S9Q7Q3_BRACR|nr:hypothetical protein F2Q69_00020041 [Brassica cretica]